jgi:hypothetical protein
LPTIQDCVDYYTKEKKLTYVAEGLAKHIEAEPAAYYSYKAHNCYILPIQSDPDDPDSDGDGFLDCLNNTIDKTNYYTIIADPYPLKANKVDKEMVQTITWIFFRQKGFSNEQVCGIMGNVSQESNWQPLLRGKNSQYWGLVQVGKDLSFGLQDKYRESGLNITLYGYNVSTYQGNNIYGTIPESDLMKIIEVQLPYIYYCRPTGYDWIPELKKAATVNLAAETFLVRFEGANNGREIDSNLIKYYEPRIGHYFQETGKRRDYAQGHYNYYKNFTLDKYGRLLRNSS